MSLLQRSKISVKKALVKSDNIKSDLNKLTDNMLKYLVEPNLYDEMELRMGTAIIKYEWNDTIMGYDVVFVKSTEDDNNYVVIPFNYEIIHPEGQYLLEVDFNEDDGLPDMTSLRQTFKYQSLKIEDLPLEVANIKIGKLTGSVYSMHS